MLCLYIDFGAFVCSFPLNRSIHFCCAIRTNDSLCGTKTVRNGLVVCAFFFTMAIGCDVRGAYKVWLQIEIVTSSDTFCLFNWAVHWNDVLLLLLLACARIFIELTNEHSFFVCSLGSRTHILAYIQLIPFTHPDFFIIRSFIRFFLFLFLQYNLLLWLFCFAMCSSVLLWPSSFASTF